MSSLIKAGDASIRRISSIAFAQQPPEFGASQVADPVVLSRLEIERLTALLAERDRQIATHAAALARARQTGEAEGRKAGRAEAEKHEKERVDLLRSAIAKANTGFDGALAALERLAVLLALDCLERIFGHDADRNVQVTAIIKKQLATLETTRVIAIEVSQQDFDQEALDRLRGDCVPPGIALECSDRLASGDCTIRLTLGGLDVGSNQQWHRLRPALAALAEPA